MSAPAFPEFPGEEIVSASEAVGLLDRYEAGSVTRALAEAILARCMDNGSGSLAEAEAHFAALEVYHRSVATDGFASLFYNEGDFVPAMLAATAHAGASASHNLLRRGLAHLGLTESASGEEIGRAGESILEDERLLEAFEMLDAEFNEKVGDLTDEMVALLWSAQSGFVHFP
jgi:hypothetical protein